MAEFKKLAAVDMVETASDTATVLIEEDGVVKRAPKDEIGGAASWNDLTDKPFYESAEPVEIVVVEENYTLGDPEGYSVENFLRPLEEGVPYIVMFDSTRYDCVGVKHEVDNRIYIGSIRYFDYTQDDGIPFTILYDPLRGEMWIYSWFDEITGTGTMSVTAFTNEVYPLDEKYLPHSVKNKADILDPVFFGSFSMNRASDSVIGSYSHAEGDWSIASGHCTHAEGKFTTASGSASHAEGGWSIASGDYSHTEGYGTESSDSYSHAEGYQTTASGYSSHAEGGNTIASGDYSHTEGYGTTASGNHSHAEGNNTIASSTCQHVQGTYNIEDSSSTYSHIVGNGSSSVRSNAHTLDWNGNAWYSGDVYIGSTSGTNRDEGSKKLATEEFVLDNRVCYEEEVTLTFEETLSHIDATTNSTQRFDNLELVKRILENGDQHTYTIRTCNTNETYVCNATWNNYGSGVGMYLYINNRHIFTIEAGPNVVCVAKQQGVTAPFNDTYFDIIVSGSYEATTIHKIPEKYLPDSVINNVSADAVSYSAPQTLTDEQREIARANIGAATNAYLNGCYDYYALNGSEYLAVVGSSLITDISKAIETTSPTNSSSNALRYLFYSINDLFGVVPRASYTFNSNIQNIKNNFNALIDAGCITTSSYSMSAYAYCTGSPNDNNAWRYYHLTYLKSSNSLTIADYNLRGNNDKLIEISLTDGSVIQDYLFATDKTLTQVDKGADAKAVGDALALKADATHNHDDVYYTEIEVDELIASIPLGKPIINITDQIVDRQLDYSTLEDGLYWVDATNMGVQLVEGGAYETGLMNIVKVIPTRIAVTWFTSGNMYAINNGVASLSKAQLKTNNTYYDLATTDKTIIGAINELDTEVSLVSDALANVAQLPAVTEADNGKVLMVVNGKWQLVTLNLSVDENGVMTIK